MNPASSSVRIAEPPWSKWRIPKELRKESSDEQLFLIMLYVKRATFSAMALYQADQDSEPDDFSTKASIMFVRLPGGSFVLMMKVQKPVSEAKNEYYSVILATGVSFRFDESPPSMQWLQDDTSFTIHFGTSEELRALVQCILIARANEPANANDVTILHEVGALQAQIKHKGEATFVAAVEAPSSTV
ncbi:uncharacterized protein B0H18DRAFT_954116 [Fomitopsis serialis]|uniref:uncharacterized protein n=1 Tax=Fomitopsis serialis TaxID=139415 RepID=UPI0020087996|nr:uncharacterized protein B0H18DRAFT_954116 [Neoantrodia serialis]KAH9928122.1 hypothetical protein B0H18DRAFT_954116 [Neoantrodia serialis]